MIGLIPGEGFSAHSPRVGMAQDLSAADAELPELMTAGRWESPTMPTRYTEAQAAGRGAVARYYRDDLRAFLTHASPFPGKRNCASRGRRPDRDHRRRELRKWLRAPEEGKAVGVAVGRLLVRE